MAHSCPTGPVSGIQGYVVCDNHRIARIKSWTATVSADEIMVADSDSGVFKRRIAGRYDIQGSFDFNYDTNFPQTSCIVEGDCCDLVLWIEQDVGHYWFVDDAFIKSLSLTVNVETAELVGGTAEFANGNAYYTYTNTSLPAKAAIAAATNC